MRVMTCSVGRVFVRAECVCDAHLQGIDLMLFKRAVGAEAVLSMQ